MRTFLAALLYVVGFAANAPAQTYPDRTIKLILPFTPGSPNDVVAR